MDAAINTLRQAGENGLSTFLVLDRMLDRHPKGTWPVSLTLTVLAMRKQMPQCDLDDRDLADMVAIRAIERGCNVIFDADLLGGSYDDERSACSGR